MKFFKQMGIEQKYGAVFGLAAFILSLLTGLVSGVSFSITIIRSLIMAPVFFIVGYGTVTVLKKYVPEIYEALVAAGGRGRRLCSLGSRALGRPYDRSRRGRSRLLCGRYATGARTGAGRLCAAGW